MILEVVFGLIFLFFVPGYALTLAIFPKELSLAERVGFAGALSIIADIVTVLFINLVLNIEITRLNVFMSILTLTIVALIVWKVRTLEVGRDSSEQS